MKKNKLIILSSVFLLSSVLLSFLATAQPKSGSMLYGVFEKSSSPLVAKVLSLNGKEFTVRFSHSNSEYVFLAGGEEGSASVISNKGGKFGKGSAFFYSEYIISDNTYGCLQSKQVEAPVVIVRFADGKSFLGSLAQLTDDGGYEIMFWHSLNFYRFDKDHKVINNSGGAYPAGTTAKIFCAQSAFEPPARVKPPRQLVPKGL